MIVIGAGGFAKEVLEILVKTGKAENLAFYDNLHKNKQLYNRFQVLNSPEEVSIFFDTYGKEFTIGIGNPVLREMLSNEFIKLGGILSSVISPHAILGSFDVTIGSGCNILDNCILSNSTTIGKGVILYYNTNVCHDSIIGDFAEMSPGATVLGNCKIGAFSQIGSNATILPGVEIGKYVKIGAGAVVTRNIPDYSVAMGVPAKVTRTVEP